MAIASQYAANFARSVELRNELKELTKELKGSQDAIEATNKQAHENVPASQNAMDDTNKKIKAAEDLLSKTEQRCKAIDEESKELLNKADIQTKLREVRAAIDPIAGKSRDSKVLLLAEFAEFDKRIKQVHEPENVLKGSCVYSCLAIPFRKD